MESKEVRTERGVEKGLAKPSPYPSMPKIPTETTLVSFGDRITYTFSYGKEVGSIHYDRARGEIFYKGHNIRNMEMEEWQLQLLEKFRLILRAESKGRSFAEDYARTLDKVTLEKKKANP